MIQKQNDIDNERKDEVMLNDVIDTFILDGPERGSFTLPRSNIYIAGLANYFSLWLRSIPNANSTLKGTMTLIDLISLSGISSLLDKSMSEQYNKVYTQARQLASSIDSASKESYLRSTFVNSYNTEEYVLTMVSSLGDHTDSWSYWKNYLPLRLVSTDAPRFNDNFLTGKLSYQSMEPGYVLFYLDVVGLALKYASCVNRKSSDIPETERGRVLGLAEFVNKYVLFPCYAYDTLNLWLLDNYKSPYFYTRSHRLSAVGGANAIRSEIETYRDDLSRSKISPSAFIRNLRFASPLGQIKGKDLYNTLFRNWDAIVQGRQSDAYRVLARNNWYGLLLDPVLAHGPEYQAIGGDLYLAADQSLANTIDTRIKGHQGKETVRKLLRQCKETGSILKR